MSRKNPNADIFWLIVLGVAIAVVFFGFVRPVMDKGKNCPKNPGTQTCIHHPGP